MKRYNKANLKWFLCGVVLPALLLFASFSGVYAYFTASLSHESSSTSTAVLRVGFSDSIRYLNSTVIEEESKLLPGDTVKLTGKVGNVGNCDIYCVLHLKVVVEGLVNEDIYYTLSNSEFVEIEDLENGSAFELTYNESTKVGQTVNYEVEYTFDPELDNALQTKKAELTLTAHAIQRLGIDTGTEAFDLLIGG